MEQPRLPDTDHPVRPRLSAVHADVMRAIIYGLEQAGYSVAYTDDPTAIVARVAPSPAVYLIETRRRLGG
jgi:hypothetical protein